VHAEMQKIKQNSEWRRLQPQDNLSSGHHKVLGTLSVKTPVSFNGQHNGEVPGIHEQIKECKEKLTDQRNAHEHRKVFLAERADIAKQNRNHSQEVAIHQKQNIEATKRNYVIISQTMERNQFRKGPSMVKVKSKQQESTKQS
jgi:hypothetical protein